MHDREARHQHVGDKEDHHDCAPAVEDGIRAICEIVEDGACEDERGALFPTKPIAKALSSTSSFATLTWGCLYVEMIVSVHVMRHVKITAVPRCASQTKGPPLRS